MVHRKKKTSENGQKLLTVGFCASEITGMVCDFPSLYKTGNINVIQYKPLSRRYITENASHFRGTEANDQFCLRFYVGFSYSVDDHRKTETMRVSVLLLPYEPRRVENMYVR